MLIFFVCPAALIFLSESRFDVFTVLFYNIYAVSSPYVRHLIATSAFAD